MINNKLYDLYTNHIKGITQLAHTYNDIDGPLLMKCWEKDYLKSNFKILFVGKECNGWIGDVSADLGKLLHAYEEFKLSKNGNRTVFWQYVYWMNSLLNPDQKEDTNFLWTNISKFCNINGKGLNWSTHIDTVNKFNCLKDEIEIVKPNVVIFFSGPYYDGKMNCQFNDQLNFTQVFEDIPIRQLAKVNHICLPHHTYRVYHPSYLQRSGLYNHIERLVDQIKNPNNL